ncbi:hypothetical protein [Cypionkella aquatica]|uniref:hypothetical protein n=1 Tax=Cypionkella aquatica TaxID=1756042 RepID=UPI0024E1649E|nr:hypothetical protein [Cypionkella aquatica]
MATQTFVVTPGVLAEGAAGGTVGGFVDLGGGGVLACAEAGGAARDDVCRISFGGAAVWFGLAYGIAAMVMADDVRRFNL